MPAYNAEETIRESIDSVIAQEYDSWELLVVDDGSTDNTKHIIESYQSSVITLLSNQYVKGAAGARRTAIESANGRYVAFLDSDDIWEPAKLKKQLAYMNSTGADFVYSDYSTFQDSVSNVKSIVSACNKLSYEDLIKNCMIGCLTVVLDKTAFDDFEFPITPKEDYAFWLKLLRQTDFAYKVPNTTSYYRLSDDSLSGNKIKEIKKQWFVIRKVEKTPLLKSLYCMLFYSFYGFFKHYISTRNGSNKKQSK